MTGNERKIIYTPPEGEYCLRLAKQSGVLIHEDSDGLDPLVMLAVMHYQFEVLPPMLE